MDPWDKLDEMMDITVPEQIAQAVAAERERCARLCDAAREWEERNGPNLDGYHMALMLGAAIREGE